MKRLVPILGMLLALAQIAPARAAGTRLKELADVQGMRENDLFGYGLVVGLAGTGDTEQVLFTSQSVAGMLGRLGVRIDPRDIRSRNVAAVMVTARFPTYARPGSRIDVTVSAMGNARSLAGGVLLVTPLAAADGNVYAVSQGAVQVGGFEGGAAGSFTQKNQPTSGRIASGASIEKAVAPALGNGPLVLALHRPDFTTASRVAAAINASLGKGAARAVDPAAVEVTAPEALKSDPVGLMAKLEALEVEPDEPARIVVSERTGTVVAGERVHIRAVAVAHGGLQIAVAQRPVISQPGPLGGGQTVQSRVAEVQADEARKPAVALPATSTVDDLVRALNLVGATPRDLISILQAMKAAGAIDAEIVVL